MEYISPLGGVYQAGTLSGNPIAMAAGLAQIRILNESSQIYKKIDMLAEKLEHGFKTTAHELECPIWVNRVGSLISVFFTKETVDNFEKAKTSNTKLYAKYFNYMIKEGIYLAPSQFEAMFVSYSHTEEDIERTIDSAKKVLSQIKKEECF
jgi:glutamate-1-semialdehyde 2,1-aminomutase